MAADDKKIIFSMVGVSKAFTPNKNVLKDIYLSFFYGAKIGIIGLNGSGKSTLLQGERSITCTSYYSLYFFNPNDFISYFLVPSTRFPLSCHSQFDIALF